MRPEGTAETAAAGGECRGRQRGRGHARRVADGPRLSGTLQPQQSATIIAEVGGTVTTVNGSEGQNVGRGTLLAVISDESAAQGARSAQTAVQSAQTAVTVARRDLDRSSSLAAAGAVPRRTSTWRARKWPTRKRSWRRHRPSSRRRASASAISA